MSITIKRERYLTKIHERFIFRTEIDEDEIELELKSLNANFKKLPEQDLLKNVVDGLVKGKAIGWMQGRMEFGPRALGARSIIGDPRIKDMQKQLNLKIKYRESWTLCTQYIKRKFK